MRVTSVPWTGPICPVKCPADILPLELEIPHKSAQTSWGRPEFIPGTLPGIPITKFLYVIVLYRLLHSSEPKKRSSHFPSFFQWAKQRLKSVNTRGETCGLAHQNRTIVIAGDFRIDGAKSLEMPQTEEVLGSEIAARNRKSLATFLRTLKSQCSIAFCTVGIAITNRNKKLRFRCAKTCGDRQEVQC